MTKKYPNIQGRLFFGLLVLIVLLLSISFFYMNDVKRLNGTIDEIVKHPYTVSNSIRDINIYINSMQRSLTNVTLAENDTQLNEAISQINGYEKLVFEKFEIVSQRYLGNTTDINSAYEAFVNSKPIRDEVIDLVKSNNLQKALAILNNEGANYGKMLMNKTELMIAFADSKANEYNAQSLIIHKNAKRKTYIFIFASLFLSFATFIWILRSVNRPLEKIIEKIRKIPPDQFINKYPENKKNKLALLDFVFIELEDQKSLLISQVNERTKELAEARKLLEESIESATIGMVRLDLTGRLLNVNKAFCKFIGYSKDELLKMKFNDFTHDQEKKIGLEFIEKVISGVIKDETLEKRYIHKSGEIIQGSVSASVVVDSSNQPLYLFTQVLDISKQKKYELELIEHKNGLEDIVKDRTKELEDKTLKLVRSQKALTYLLEDVNEAQAKMKILNKQIAASNKELESFSYSVSHDLKSPLRAVTGFSQILKEDYASELSQEAKRYLGLISDNADNMGELINDLLSFSRLGRTALQISQVDLHHIISRVRSELSSEIKDRNLTFSILPMPLINADEALMYNVMSNLISNAVKFTSTNEEGKVEIGCEIKSNENAYYIKDNGIGFDMKYADKIFDVFQRLNNNDDFQGTGIGLSIVQRVINKHNGKIWVKSEINKGTTFFFAI